MNRLFTLIILIAASAIAACSETKDSTQIIDPAPFRVGFPPDENPSEIIRKNTALLDYLKKHVGLGKMEIVVPPTYTAAIEQMRDGKLDMVYFGGLTYVLAKNELDVVPIVRGIVDGSPDNFTLIVTRKDSGIKSLEDLKGRSFAFGDVASTSGHLIPHKALKERGIDPNKDFSKLDYTGAHDKTAFAVFEGKVDAGAMNARLYPILIKKGQINEEEMTVLWKSEPFADYPWAVRADVGETLANKLTAAFTDLDDPVMLKELGVQGYEKTSDADFENIRQAAISLGFMEK